MPARKDDGYKVIKIKKGESLKSIYAKVRKAFTADRLQRYTVDEPMVPAKQVLEDLEALDRRHESLKKKKRKPKNAPSR
jgi:hypothetical protein